MDKKEFEAEVDLRIEELRKEGKLYEYDVKNSVPFNSKMGGISSVLSNMYPCLIYHKCEFDGKVRVFNGIDHLYHFLLFQHDEELRNLFLDIKGVRACFDAKELAKKYDKKKNEKYIDIKDNWNLLYQCMVEKAKCSDDFRKALISTKGKYLVEYEWWSKSLEAGCAKRGNKFLGENYCGRAMMHLRDKILKGEI